ncbi:MAG: hypothetical protein JXA06_05605 [Bacteroidetes bacterium]|nr:hypothetical protein [Bacteroidota bacterium]
MDKENEIFEYEWWKVFIGYVILFIVSVIFLTAIIFGIQVTEDRYSLIQLIGLAFFGIMGLLFSISGIWIIRFVPKLVTFKQDNIVVLYPFGKEKVFLYKEIDRIIVLPPIIKRSQLLTTSWSPYKFRIYFSDTSRIFINSDRLVNFPVFFDRIKNKGSIPIIEQK